MDLTEIPENKVKDAVIKELLSCLGNEKLAGASGEECSAKTASEKTCVILNCEEHKKELISKMEIHYAKKNASTRLLLSVLCELMDIIEFHFSDLCKFVEATSKMGFFSMTRRNTRMLKVPDLIWTCVSGYMCSLVSAYLELQGNTGKNGM